MNLNKKDLLLAVGNGVLIFVIWLLLIPISQPLSSLFFIDTRLQILFALITMPFVILLVEYAIMKTKKSAKNLTFNVINYVISVILLLGFFFSLVSA